MTDFVQYQPSEKLIAGIYLVPCPGSKEVKFCHLPLTAEIAVLLHFIKKVINC